jgi:hypothetical protein
MKAKPNLDNFLAGGTVAAAEQPATTSAAESPAHLVEQRRTKSIRLTHSLDLFIKGEAFRRTMASGKRVNESDLIEEALLSYFNIEK